MAEDQTDLLTGHQEIAAFLGWTVPAVRRVQYRGDLPVFKFGGRICATRSGLREWIREREREAVATLRAHRGMPAAAEAHAA